MMPTIPHWTPHRPSRSRTTGPLVILDSDQTPARPSTCIIPEASCTGRRGGAEVTQALDENVIANARLIAAAPRMLGVLEGFRP